LAASFVANPTGLAGLRVEEAESALLGPSVEFLLLKRLETRVHHCSQRNPITERLMNPLHSCVDNMLAIWNEPNLDRIRGRLEAALAPHIIFVDPTIETHGIDEFEQNVRGFRAKYPDAVIRRASGIDSHHNLHRYSWEISAKGKVVLVGFDVAEVDADGKVRRVLGFFAQLPGLSQ
jgi:hypothetical protein